MRLRRDAFQLSSLFAGVGATLTSAAASVCCTVRRESRSSASRGAILAAGLKPYRPYLMAGSALLLGLALWSLYGRGRGGRACAVKAGTLTRTVVWGGLVLWLAALALQFAADRYWL